MVRQTSEKKNNIWYDNVDMELNQAQKAEHLTDVNKLILCKYSYPNKCVVWLRELETGSCGFH